MQLSDLISIIGILLAIIAFVNENERLFIWNKFNKKDKALIVIAFTFIHYLLFYDWFLRNLSFLRIFSFNSFPSTNTWSYFICLITLVLILYKIFIAGFPKENNIKVFEYYEFLLIKKEYALFFNLIKKYNSKLLLNNTQKSEKDRLNLVNLIFSNKQLLEKTAEYNFDYFSSILDNHILKKIFIENYAASQLLNENSFFNTQDISKARIEQLTILLSKTENGNHLISQNLIKTKINYNSILKLIFEYYKNDEYKSDEHIIESWLSIVKNKNIDALAHYTDMLTKENIVSKNYLEIVKKITIKISQANMTYLFCIFEKKHDTIHY